MLCWFTTSYLRSKSYAKCLQVNIYTYKPLFAERLSVQTLGRWLIGSNLVWHLQCLFFFVSCGWDHKVHPSSLIRAQVIRICTFIVPVVSLLFLFVTSKNHTVQKYLKLAISDSPCIFNNQLSTKARNRSLSLYIGFFCGLAQSSLFGRWIFIAP